MRCALCRQGWQPALGAELEGLCGQLGIDWRALQLRGPVALVNVPAAPDLGDFAAAAPGPPVHLWLGSM